MFKKIKRIANILCILLAVFLFSYVDKDLPEFSADWNGFLDWYD